MRLTMIKLPEPAKRPTMYFVGVTTGQSSIMKMFPIWAKELGLDAEIKGIDLPNVCTAPEIIMGEKKISGKIVAVIGSGMTGLETTEILNESGNHVVGVEMAEEIAPSTWFQLKDDELSRIQKYDTEFMPGKRLMKITEDSVILEDVRTSMLTTVTVDEVVLSLGVRPVNALAKALENQYPYVVTVGDACKSGRIADAVHSAYDAVMRIK